MPSPLSRNMNTVPAIGVDLGATKIASALVDPSGRVLGARQTPTRAADGAAAVCDRIAGEVRALLAEARGAAAGVGIGSPGFVDGDRGVVRAAVNLGWDELPLADEIRPRLHGVPGFLGEDAHLLALREGNLGAPAGRRKYGVLT